ncbi:MAG: hypothetical protein WC242_00005 [Candidatus Paceibacterota bacterium]|jgi:hypothetical protein
MEQRELKKFMTFNKDGGAKIPLVVFEVNGSYIVGVYQGTLSDFDILIKYRQKINGEWSRIRTPKHIHWAVDILIKMHEDKTKTQSFLDFFLGVWSRTVPVRSRGQQQDILSIDTLLKDSQTLITEYEALSGKGEYSIKFLILLAKLLMIQEKTNLETAFMFKNLLEALRGKGDIFSVVSIASHNGR